MQSPSRLRDARGPLLRHCDCLAPRLPGTRGFYPRKRVSIKGPAPYTGSPAQESERLGAERDKKTPSSFCRKDTDPLSSEPPPPRQAIYRWCWSLNSLPLNSCLFVSDVNNSSNKLLTPDNPPLCPPEPHVQDVSSAKQSQDAE